MVFILYREKASEQHHKVVECFYDQGSKEGMEITLKKEIDLKASDLSDNELVVSIGKQLQLV